MATSDIINSIKTNLTNAYTKLNDKGATIPTNKNIENLASTIETVTAGGGIEIGGYVNSNYFAGLFIHVSEL